jgi:hypothetical protein
VKRFSCKCALMGSILPLTQTEKRIRQKRQSKGVLVPLLEDLFSRQLEIEESDVEFLTMLLDRMVVRGDKRKNQPLYSPSQLSSCLRYVYLLKHHQNLGISKRPSTRPEANYYFFTGNWVHLKWQFALYKLDKKLSDDVFKLIGCEIPIVSKWGDHGGTVDAIVMIYGKLYIVDFKGLNVRTFTEITRGYVPLDYSMQIADYGMLFNSQRVPGAVIENGLLIAESKGGPDASHPIALHETEIVIKTRIPEVRGRLKELRNYESQGEIPEPECTSTQTLQFNGCPFAGHCRQEVKVIQRRRRDAEGKDAEGYRVAIPGRNGNRRSRRNSKRRS